MARSKLLLETPSIPYSANLSLHSSISYSNIIKNELNLNHELNLSHSPYAPTKGAESWLIKCGKSNLFAIRYKGI